MVNRVLRKLFMPEIKKVRGNRRRIHNEELHELYSSHQILFGRINGLGMWHVLRGAYRVLVEKTEGKRPLGRPRRRWEDNIRKD